MMIYGKSSQDGTPSPENPVEIKSVVNPTVKVRGANLLKLDFTSKSNSGVTIDVVENRIRFHGTINSTYAYFGLDNKVLIKKGTKVSLYVDDYNNHGAFVWFRKVDNYTTLQTLNKNLTNITLDNDSYLSQIGIEGYTPGDTIDFTTTFAVLDNTNQYEPYHEQNVTLPYTLNAIPVESGGNVTIGGQQYIADYVDVERGKLVKMVGVTDQDTFVTSKWSDTGSIVIYSQISNVSNENAAIVTISSKFTVEWSASDEIHHFTQQLGQTLVIILPKTITTVEQGEEIRAKGFEFYYMLATPIETDLTEEEISAFKSLATYYPTTNISVNSEQLDGYTVFNYPISMANGWNYVKQQLNDNRDYIYDMDLQSAEAYVNSEYAVALTELEV